MWPWAVVVKPPRLDLLSEPTAEQGLKLAIEKSPNLILMDIQLPGMYGITALKQLKAEPKTKSIPVIAITASAMTYNRATMLAEGLDGYQVKPIRFEGLSRRSTKSS